MYAFAIKSMVHCGSASARLFRASLLLHTTCVRSCCTWRASCVAAPQQNKNQKRNSVMFVLAINRQTICELSCVAFCCFKFVCIRATPNPVWECPWAASWPTYYCAPLVGVLISGVAVWRLDKQTNKQTSAPKKRVPYRPTNIVDYFHALAGRP